MNLGIGARLGIMASLLIVTTTVIVGWWALSSSRAVLMEHEEVDLGDDARLNGVVLVRPARPLREDLYRLSGEPVVAEWLRQTGDRDAEQAEKARRVFNQLRAEKRAYLQIDFLPADGIGIDPVCVRQPGVEVRREEHRRYLPGWNHDDVVLSAVRKNQDATLNSQPVPVLRAARPLFRLDKSGQEKQLVGHLVITMNFTAILEEVSRSPRFLVYVTNEEGQYLVHPDPRECFRFEREQTVPRIYDQNMMPELWPFYDPKSSKSQVRPVGLGSNFLTSYRYPRSGPAGDQRWRPQSGEQYFILAFPVKLKAEEWAELNEAERKRVADYFQDLKKRYPEAHIVTSDRVDGTVTKYYLRATDRDTLEDIRREIAQRFGDWLDDSGRIVEFDENAVHFYRILYTGDGEQARWFGMASAASTDEIVSDIDDKVTGVVQVMVVLGIAGVSLAWFLSSFLTRPLKNITRATKQLAQGEFDVQLPLQGGGEIGTLARSFSRMIEQLSSREQQIRRLNDDLLESNQRLEQRVRERTVQLQRLNRDLEQARDKALEASRAKDVFLAQMSHELRTPLNAIKGYSELLIEEAEERGIDGFVPDLQKILHAGGHLLTLINDILDLSKIEAQRVELHLETFDLVPLLDAIGHTVEPLVKKRNNRYVTQFDGDLGALHADKLRLRQVLLNLLSNAAKFTDNGTVTLEVEREATAASGWLVFRVRDSGIGMSAEQLTKLFKPFSQVDSSTTRRYEGTGLGLAISRSFAELMGGTLNVASEAGVGSVFTLRLPATVVPPQPAKLEKGSSEVLRSNTILVIDDDPIVRELMQRFLEKEGYQVAVAADGAEGVRLAREIRPCAITLDVMMPGGMDGWEVLTTLKADPTTSDIPVVMVTIVDDKSLGYALGATEYMTKPIDRERLSAILHKHRSHIVGREVLVVEDDAPTREVLRRLLEKVGWQVREADNGRVALEALAEKVPALVLLDLMMPEVDGFEVARQMRANPLWKQILVVVLTAKDLTPEDRAALNGSVARVLQKGDVPLDRVLGELRDLVGDCLPGDERSASDAANPAG